MQLKQFCQICESKHKKRIFKLEESLKDSPALIPLAVSQLPALKPVTLVSESRFSNSSLLKYSCGHIIAIDSIAAEKQLGYSALNSEKRAYEYQVDGVDFIESTNYNCLIADEMGLGKTAQGLIAIRKLIAKFFKLDEKSGMFQSDKGPVIIVVKSNTIYQWLNNYKEWASESNIGICPVMSSAFYPIPGFAAYIVSMDLLPAVVDKLIALKPSLVLADEVQSFKNVKSARSKALVKLIQDGNVQHKIFLSGTPIKNNAAEYFLALNLLAPSVFPSFRKFCIQWLEPDEKGQYKRIRPRLLQAFRELTAKWIIRRECKDVQKDLPPVRRDMMEVVCEDESLRKMYNAELDLFTNWMNDQSQAKDAVSMLGWLARLRHVTGIAKITPCAEYVKDWLESSASDEPGKPKIAIGIHHKDVRDNLHYALEPYGCLTYSGEDNNSQKALKIKQFNSPDYRVLVINEISGGTGTDGLQDNCYNCIVLERQWTWADERQFEKRFDRTGQQFPVRFVYMMIHGSADTILAQYVADKQRISQETFGLDYDVTGDVGGLREISELIIQGGHI